MEGSEVMEGNGCFSIVPGSRKTFSESARSKSGSLSVVSHRNTYSCMQWEVERGKCHVETVDS